MALDGIVFLHGWTMRGSVFDDLISRLSVDVPCFAPDLPGHGSSADLEPSLEHAVAQVDALFREENLGRALLVGWSMGAAISWSFIRKFGQDRLSGLMTIDMSPRLANDADWPHGLYKQDADSLMVSSRRMRNEWPRSIQSIVTNMYGSDRAPDGFSSEAALAQVSSNRPAAMWPLWDDMVAMDLRDVIPGITVPYIAAFGARSRVYPQSAAEWLARTAQNARSLPFRQSGHSPHLEEPEAFAKAVHAFAEELKGA